VDRGPRSTGAALGFGFDFFFSLHLLIDLSAVIDFMYLGGNVTLSGDVCLIISQVESM